jgi:hypothetical protein
MVTRATRARGGLPAARPGTAVRAASSLVEAGVTPRLISGVAVPSGGASRIGVACGRPVMRPTGGRGLAAARRATCRHVSLSLDFTADVGDDEMVSRGRVDGNRSARRADLRVVAERTAGDSGDRDGGRRLRVAPAVQLELACGPEETRSASVWEAMPAGTREAVLVVLARLIGVGAVEERS